MDFDSAWSKFELWGLNFGKKLVASSTFKVETNHFLF